MLLWSYLVLGGDCVKFLVTLCGFCGCLLILLRLFEFFLFNIILIHFLTVQIEMTHRCDSSDHIDVDSMHAESCTPGERDNVATKNIREHGSGQTIGVDVESGHKRKLNSVCGIISKGG